MVASGSGSWRWIDVMWMITPEPWSSIVGNSARSSRTAGNRFRSSARCHSASSSTAKPPAGADEPPTTWTMMSIPPSRSRTASTIAAQPSAVVMSAATNRSSGARSPCRERAVVRTVAPAARNCDATAAPIPLVPPVTSARRPSSSSASLINEPLAVPWDDVERLDHVLVLLPCFGVRQLNVALHLGQWRRKEVLARVGSVRADGRTSQAHRSGQTDRCGPDARHQDGTGHGAAREARAWNPIHNYCQYLQLARRLMLHTTPCAASTA